MWITSSCWAITRNRSMAEDALDVGCGATSLALQCAAAQGIIAGRVTTFGRVPLFYYIVHIYLLHASAILFAWITIAVHFFAAKPDGYGLGLVGIYVVWLAMTILLWPPCAWFAAIKRRRIEWWWSYL
jgi:hypothetical protein